MEDRRGSRFVEVDFAGSAFRGVDLSNVTISDAWLVDVDISGHLARVTINGVEVSGYVEQQLDERHPERRLLRRTDADGMRQAWAAVVELAGSTLERARGLAPERLDESVDDEWSYVQTLRHLVYATDRWITGPVLGEAAPFHPLGLPNPPLDALPPGVFALDARPRLEEVLAVRTERMNSVGAYLATAAAADLDREVTSPNGGTTTVRHCIHVVFDEEWWHDQYANRDLAIIEQR